jgi:hypothetical protein
MKEIGSSGKISVKWRAQKTISRTGKIRMAFVRCLICCCDENIKIDFIAKSQSQLSRRKKSQMFLFLQPRASRETKHDLDSEAKEKRIARDLHFCLLTRTAA